MGVPVHKGAIDRGVLNEWWSGRAIPASRMGIREALHELGLPVPGVVESVDRMIVLD